MSAEDIFRFKNNEMFQGLQNTKAYQKGQIIYQQGDEAGYVYYLKHGRVQIYVASSDGSEKTLAAFSGESLFGKSAFFEKMPRASCAKAITKSEIICIDKSMMMDIISRYPQFAIDMLEYLSKTIRVFSNQIENMVFLQADKRIARYIADNVSDSKQSVACTHDEIAGAIGVSRVTVSNILREFVQNGWIDTGYRIIQVTDLKALTDFAQHGR